MKEFKDRLAEIESIFSVTLTDISDRTGIPLSTISMYKNGKRSPKQDKITAICKEFNLNEAWLMGYDVQMEKPTTTYQDVDTDLMVKIMLDYDNYANLITIIDKLSKENRDRLYDYAQILLKTQ